MSECDGCKWWSEMVAESIGCGPMTAMCFNEDSCHNQKMVYQGCDKHTFGIAVDSPYRRYE